MKLIVEPVLVCEEKIRHQSQIELAVGERQSRQGSRCVTMWMGLEIREKNSGRAFALCQHVFMIFVKTPAVRWNQPIRPINGF